MSFSTSRPRFKLRWLLVAGAVSLGTLVLAAVVLAVHDDKFQLDGDTSPLDIAPITGITRPVDWDSLYDADKSIHDPSPTNFVPADMTVDYKVVASGGKAGQFDTSDGSTFTGGSKDTLDIHTGWRCVGANNVTNKGDITNAYATNFTNTAGDSILYFGMEKYVPQGTNNIGIWFLQDKNVGCAENGTGSGNAFDGVHKNGDLLVVSAFDGGGKVSTILAYSWDTSLNNGAGGLHLETPTAGVDCRATPVPPSDKICGSANSAAIAIKWAHASNADGSGNPAGASATIPAATFFEGGINTDAFDAFKGKCFTHYMFDTRSAVTTNATLYDYALGEIGECTSTTVTTPKKFVSTAVPPESNIPAGGLTIPTTASGGSIQVKDSALITVTGISSFTSSVKFTLCGPADFTSQVNCKTGGTQIGDPVAVTTSPQTVLSEAVTLTSTGKYCWRAEFAGDSVAEVPGSVDPDANGDTPDSLSECFTVNPVTPTLSTTAVDPLGAPLGTTAVDFGSPIYDKAALQGTASKPASPVFFESDIAVVPTQEKAGGAIVFKLYGPSATATASTADCNKLAKDANGVDFPSAGISVNVDGDGTYPAANVNPSTVTFTPGAPGYYYWKAAYGGNTPNTTAAPLDATGNPTQHNADCSVASERVQVQQIPTQISTAQSAIPNDSATITSSAPGNILGTGGTVVFKLYGPTGSGATAKTALQNCQAGGDTVAAGRLYAQTINNVGGLHSVTVGTSNTTVSVNVSETYYWNVTYQPSATDTAHTGRQSACAENTVLTFNNSSGTGTLFP